MPMFYKQFKDPIYGYIEIDNNIVMEIIDTPAFQRLKDIRQTSYAPLFPAAYHNRYVHSLGVYHLGRIAFKAIKPQLIEYSKNTALNEKIEKIEDIFHLACLLHDIGHAPFSHTGENFFLDKTETLYHSLKECVDEAYFTRDFSVLGLMPAPHECMSCVVGLRAFSEYFSGPEERSLFARCIIGMQIQFRESKPKFMEGMNEKEKKEVKKKREKYASKKKETELLNCIISLLNSSIIDVDRLDYIIRDSATIGFKNAQVDYMRLLKGMRIVTNQGRLCIGYHKSALSVIESAVYAHDAEKKWIQNHPSILYEMEALKNAMSTLTGMFSSESDPNPIFCYEALTEEGKLLSISRPLFSKRAIELYQNDNLWSASAKELLDKGELFHEKDNIGKERLTITEQYPLSLLADEDILYLMKIFCKSGLGYEYFARDKRRSAIWKSEAEFRALFQVSIGENSRNIKILESNFEELVDFCQNKTGVPIVDNKIFELLDKEEKDADRAKENDEIDDEFFEDIMRGVKEKRHWSMVLKDIAACLVIPFEFLIIFQKKFNSSFKESIGDIPILFPNLENSVVPFKDVVDVLKTDQNKKSNFFHLFYQSKGAIDETRKREIVNTIAGKLIAATNYL